MGYSPWGCKELDTTECLTHTHTVETKNIKQSVKQNKSFVSHLGYKSKLLNDLSII